MSALYPLRMNSKYQAEIELLETMGFNADTAAQYLEEHDGNVLLAVETLLQQEKIEHENQIENVDNNEGDAAADGEMDRLDEPEGEPLQQQIHGMLQQQEFYHSLCDAWKDVAKGFKSFMYTYHGTFPSALLFVCVAALVLFSLAVLCLDLYRGAFVLRVQPTVATAFNTVYDFEDVLFGDDDVIIKHIYHYNAYLQLSWLEGDEVRSKNMVKSNVAVWSVERIHDEKELAGDGRKLVKLVNKHSGTYLRIHQCGRVNAGGNGGSFTLFEATVVEAHNHNLKGVRLESVKYPGNYVVIRSDGSIGVTNDCDGDIDCVLIFMTTERPMELINWKNELRIVELQQQIQDLKVMLNHVEIEEANDVVDLWYLE